MVVNKISKGIKHSHEESGTDGNFKSIPEKEREREPEKERLRD